MAWRRSGADAGGARTVSTPFALSQVGCGRATAYAESNKIVTLGNKTHVAWLDSEKGRFVVRVRTLHRDTHSWSPAFTVGQAHDNHGGPALAADSAGHLHIVYGPHHHPFRYRRSARANDASQWTQEQRFGTRCTYPALVCQPDDTLLLACRESTAKRWVLNLYRKPADGQWQGPRTLLHGGAPSGYTRWQTALALGPDGALGTLHMGFMLYESGLKGLGYAVGYLRSGDGGKTWRRSDGTKVALPATPATIDLVAGARSPASPANFRPGNIAVDPKGSPWLIYCRMDRRPFRTWLARPTGKGQWQETPLLPAIQRKWPKRGVKTPGDLAFDRDGVLYVVVTTVPADVTDKTAQWGHPSAEVALLVSKDQARTFRAFGISPHDAATPNWLPNLERPTRHVPIGAPSLIYTHGHRGEKNTDILSNDVVWCDAASRAAK